MWCWERCDGNGAGCEILLVVDGTSHCLEAYSRGDGWDGIVGDDSGGWVDIWDNGWIAGRVWRGVLVRTIRTRLP